MSTALSRLCSLAADTTVILTHAAIATAVLSIRAEQALRRQAADYDAVPDRIQQTRNSR